MTQGRIIISGEKTNKIGSNIEIKGLAQDSVSVEEMRKKLKKLNRGKWLKEKFSRIRAISSFFTDIKKYGFTSAVFKVMFLSCGYKRVVLGFYDQNKDANDKIMNIIKTNGFVECNRKGEWYLKGFTLLEIHRDNDKNIIGVYITHDIDSVVSKPTKKIGVAGKVSNLQNMINYFDRI